MEAYVLINKNEELEIIKKNLESVGINKIKFVPFLLHDIDNDWMLDKGFELRENYRREYADRKGLTTNEVMRSISHLKVWKKASASNSKRTLVLESSVLLNKKHFNKKKQNYLNTDEIILLSDNVIEDAKNFLEQNIKGYIFSNKMAKKMLDIFKSNLMSFDEFMLWYTNLRGPVVWSSESFKDNKASWKNNFVMKKNQNATEFSTEKSDILHNPNSKLYLSKKKNFMHIIIANKLSDGKIKKKNYPFKKNPKKKKKNWKF